MYNIIIYLSNTQTSGMQKHRLSWYLLYAHLRKGKYKSMNLPWNVNKDKYVNDSGYKGEMQTADKK